MHPQAIHALAAEGGDQGRMDIQDAPRPLLCKFCAEDDRKACEENEVDLLLAQQHGKLVFKRLLPTGGREHARRNTRVFRPRERIGPRAGRNDQHDLAVRHFSVTLRVEQRLQIRAAAGDQHGDAGGCQHSSTFSSPNTISPMTPAS